MNIVSSSLISCVTNYLYALCPEVVRCSCACMVMPFMRKRLHLASDSLGRCTKSRIWVVLVLRRCRPKKIFDLCAFYVSVQEITSMQCVFFALCEQWQGDPYCLACKMTRINLTSWGPFQTPDVMQDKGFKWGIKRTQEEDEKKRSTMFSISSFFTRGATVEAD